MTRRGRLNSRAVAPASKVTITRADGTVERKAPVRIAPKDDQSPEHLEQLRELRRKDNALGHAVRSIEKAFRSQDNLRPS